MKFNKKGVKHAMRSVMRRYHSLIYLSFYRKIKRINHLQRIDDPRLKSWKRLWSGLEIKPRRIYFDVFGHYMDDMMDIVPEDICHDIIEPILDPLPYIGYYSDKNLYDVIFPAGFLPKTILRRMDGVWKDAGYSDVKVDAESFLERLKQSGATKVVIKPSTDSCSGVGVNLAQYDNSKWKILGSNDILNLEFIDRSYSGDIIIQQAVNQHPYMSQFNPTSVNTLRLTLYKSVKTNQWVVPSAIIRIGANGAYKDNAHQGGGYALLNSDGTLGHKILNQWGESVTLFNGIDFAASTFKIPEFDRVVEFAKEVGARINQQRLLALDITIDNNGQPHLIEFNLGGYSMWLFQYAGKGAFGKYTEEIIEYCRKHIDKATQKISF